MSTKIAIVMQLPEGKQPGFYAQIIKGLAGKVQLFDREKETLIVQDESEQLAVLEVLDHYRVERDVLEVFLLPGDARVSPLFGDYGFVSRMENRYLDLPLVSFFRFVLPDGHSPAEPQQALRQMDEHLIACFAVNGVDYYTVDKQLEELMTGIARAYSCSISFEEL